MNDWKRSLWAAAAAQFLCVTAWHACLPFLPYYVRDLGVAGPEEGSVWAGLLFSADAITMALMSPVWGLLADRYGVKLKLTRPELDAVIAYLTIANDSL